MIPVTWHVITIADGERFAVVVGETTIASFATPEEADTSASSSRWRTTPRR